MRFFKSEYYHSLENNFPEEALAEFKHNLLSISDMREAYNKRREDWGVHTEYNINLQVDKKTGLYYVDHDFVLCEDLLINHLLVEQLFEKKNKVDWKRVTNCYDYKVLDKIHHLLTTPLVWFPTEDVGDECVVVGKVAEELDPPENFSFQDGRYGFYREMRDQGLIWFANTLPQIGDIYNTNRYEKLPVGMVLWDRLLYGGFMNLHDTMEFIVENSSYAKAVEIVERFRMAWPNIIKLNLFDIRKLKEYEVERHRLELFDNMEPYLEGWKTQIENTQKKETASEHENPIVFVSYSWDDEQHEKWVLQLASDLVSNGIDVILDKWEMRFGKLLPHFMEHAIKDSQRVICVITPNYKKKTEGLAGGVGVEYSIMSAEIQKNIKTEKFIPLFRIGNKEDDIPTFLEGRDFVDMRDDAQYKEKMEELIRDILNKPKYKKPVLGNIPKFD